jgi:membrane-associated protease RseP (regulator of RpoE activity)
MRAHSLRRLLWLLNGLLGLAVLGVLAVFFLRVRPAIADPAFLKPAFADAAVQAFLDKPQNPDLKLGTAVTIERLEEVDRPVFKTDDGRRYHWPYSGPVPPPKPQAAPREEVREPVISALEKTGTVRMILWIPPRAGETVASETVVYWEFLSGGQRAIKPGERIELERGTGNLVLVDVRRVPDRSGQYVLVYQGVNRAGEPQGPPQEYVWNSAPTGPDPLADVLRVRRPAGEAAPASATGGSPAPAPLPGATAAATTAEVPPAGPIRRENVTLEERAPDQFHVRFDDRSREYFRQMDVDTLAQGVKTQPARDAAGNPIGLRITGFAGDSPAEFFDVRPGDILVSINGQRIATRSDAINVAQGIDPNTRLVAVVIDRNGRLVTFNVDPHDVTTQRQAGHHLGLESGERMR